MVDYELIEANGGHGTRYSWWRICALVAVYIATTMLVFIAWNSIYDDNPQYLTAHNEVPQWWYERALYYANHIHEHTDISHDIRLVRNQTTRPKPLLPPQLVGSAPLIASKNHNPRRLVCYYTTPSQSQIDDLHLTDVDANLCTHINIGMATVRNSTILLPDDLMHLLHTEVPVLRTKNAQLKFLLWVGGGDASSSGFSEMVRNHSTRKTFVRSLKNVLHQYQLDGVDLDWEFPSAYNKERQHLSQLLYEIRQEYSREQLQHLLSVAVAAPEGIALFAYDINELNKYADYVNLMSYDYHFYTHGTPFTGLNAPLYARANEHSILATLNINYSVNWWLTNGLDRDKLVVGLPTYGHSFTLVNPFNTAIGAPAEAIGHCGNKGFATYNDVCWFNTHNLVSLVFDQSSCSPYLSSGSEWISYDNIKSMECKAKYVRAQQLGGIMVFSLNTDDYSGACRSMSDRQAAPNANSTFPLVRTANNVLFSAN